MLAYLRSENVLNDAMEFSVSTKQSDVGWGASPKDARKQEERHGCK